MSVQAQNKVLNLRLLDLAKARGLKLTNAPTLKFILLSLANFVDEHDRSSASVRKIAFDCEINISTVRRAFITLEQLGLISRSYRRVTGNRNDTNITSLHLDKPLERKVLGEGRKLRGTPSNQSGSPDLDRVANCEAVGRKLRGKRTSLNKLTITSGAGAPSETDVSHSLAVEQNQPKTQPLEKFLLSAEWMPNSERLNLLLDGEGIPKEFVQKQTALFLDWALSNQTYPNTQNGWTKALYKHVTTAWFSAGHEARRLAEREQARDALNDAVISKLNQKAHDLQNTTPRTTIDKLTDRSWADRKFA